MARARRRDGSDGDLLRESRLREPSMLPNDLPLSPRLEVESSSREGRGSGNSVPFRIREWASSNDAAVLVDCEEDFRRFWLGLFLGELFVSTMREK